VASGTVLATAEEAATNDERATVRRKMDMGLPLVCIRPRPVGGAQMQLRFNSGRSGDMGYIV
jgi:hypothetical protein